MKVTDNSTYRLMQTNLDRITNDLLTLRTQGATGLKLSKSSDDPGAIRPVLTTRSQLQQNNRFLETMGQAGDKMAATDGHLAQVENVLVRVKELAINAINGSLGSNDLDTLADEIAEMRAELLDTANAVVDGKYIFAGYQEDTKPFSLNPNYDPSLYDVAIESTWPVFYHGDHNPTRLEITPGEVIATNLTGNELFLGITNAIAASGSAYPYQGQVMHSGPIGPGTPLNDITITPAGNPPVPVTILGADLTDPVGENNYAAKVAGLLSQAGTGLTATTNPAVANLGSLPLADFVDGQDRYTLNIGAGGTAVTATLDGPSGSFDFSLAGMALALGNTAGASNVSLTGGTLSNGVRYDISSGSLVLTGPGDGAEIDLNEIIDDGVVVIGAPLPASVIAGGNQTVYGTLNVAPNSTTEVNLAGPGLADIGLTADTLDGASGRIDIFAVLTRLEEAVRAGNVDDPNGAGGGMQAQLANLEIAANQNRGQRSSLGARAQRVETAILHQEDARIDLRQILSRYEDADMIQVFNDIVQKETAFQAALNVSGRVSQISILDYF